MKQYRYFMVCLFALCLFFQTALSAGAEVCNRVVAIVDDDVITLHELNTKFKQLTGQDAEEMKKQDQQAFVDTRRKVLNFIIDDKITQKKVEELGIKVTPAEVDAAIEKVKHDNKMTQADLLNQLQKQGLTLEAYRENVKNELERFQLVNFEVKSKIIIREESIKEYYKQHESEFVTREHVHMAAIMLTPTNPADQQERQALVRQAEDICRRLKAGEDFGDLAKRFSSGPGAATGGDLGVFDTGELNPALLRVIDKMKPGDFSEPVETPSSVQVLKLIERQPGGSKSFEEVKDRIQGLLYREEINKRYEQWLQQLRNQAYTKIIF